MAFNLDEMLGNGTITQEQYNKYKQVNPGLAQPNPVVTPASTGLPPINNTMPANIQAFDNSQRIASKNNFIPSLIVDDTPSAAQNSEIPDELPAQHVYGHEAVNVRNQRFADASQMASKSKEEQDLKDAQQRRANFEKEQEYRHYQSKADANTQAVWEGKSLPFPDLQKPQNTDLPKQKELSASEKADENTKARDAGKPLPFPDVLPTESISGTRTEDSTSTEAKPVIGMGGPVVNPAQGLIDNLNNLKASYFGKPEIIGNNKNLSAQEQARLDQIDNMVANGTIPKEQGDKLKEAVSQASINRTTIPGQKGTFERLGENLESQSKLEQDLAKQQALLTKAYAGQADEADHKELQLLNENTAKLEEKAKAIDEFAKQAPTYKEDANKYWKDMGAGRQVLFGVGALLEAAGKGWNGKTGSMAFDQLNTQINRDIEAQRKTYEAASDKFKTQLNNMGQSYARSIGIMGKSEEAAKLVKIQMLNQYQRNMEVLAQTSQSDQVKIAAEKAKIGLDQQEAKLKYELYNQQWQLLHPAKGGGAAGSPASAQIVNTISEAVGKQENYNQAAQDILSLANAGDVNLNPNSLDKVGSWFKGLGGSDLEKAESLNGKNGAAIIRRVAQVVGDNPITGEHSDADREFALKNIVGEGDPQKIAQRLQQRAQKSAKEAQRQAAALSPKQQIYVQGNMLPPQAPQSTPTLSGQRQ